MQVDKTAGAGCQEQCIKVFTWYVLCYGYIPLFCSYFQLMSLCVCTHDNFEM